MVSSTDYDLLFSNSQISKFLTCQAAYRHEYIRRVSPRKRPLYFVVGSAVHAFLEVFYQTKDITLAFAAAEAVFDEVDTSLMAGEEVHALEIQRAVALGMCSAYPDHYKQDFDQFQSFMPEKDHAIFICEQKPAGRIGYRAILDTLCKDAAGDWWIMEHKTPAQVTSAYLRRVYIDWQIMGQMHVAKDILGHFPKGVVYNVIKKPAIRLRSGETHTAFRKRIGKEYSNRKIAETKRYFTREEIIIGKKPLEQWWEQSTYVMQMMAIRISTRSKFWPMNTSACTANYGQCPYLDACIDGRYNKLQYMKRPRR